MFCVLEGIDGCGKSTQASRLVAARERVGRSVVHLREPGATPLGERLRSIVLDRAGVPIEPRAEALLYSTARAQLVASVIRPALEAGRDVVCERYFYSTMAYQGAGLGLSLPDLEVISRFATGGLLPDRVILLDLPVAISRARLAGGRDRIESRDAEYFERVRAAFLAFARADATRFRVVDASRGVDEVAREVAEGIDAVS